MTAPLSVSTDVSAQIAALRAQISALKIAMASPEQAAVFPGHIDSRAQQIADLQTQLDTLTNPSKSFGPGITPPPSASPTFAGAQIDVGRVNVGDLKLVNYPGAT